MGPTTSSSANDPHQSAVTELSVTRTKVPAAATGARRSSIRGMKSELTSPRGGDRVPVLVVEQGKPQPGHPDPAGLKELRAAKLLSETYSSWDRRDSGPGCSLVPEGRERLHNPHAKQDPKGDGGMGQKGLQSRAGVTAVLSPFPSSVTALPDSLAVPKGDVGRIIISQATPRMKRCEERIGQDTGTKGQ